MTSYGGGDVQQARPTAHKPHKPHLQATKPPRPTGMMGASLPPTTITSASPLRMWLAAAGRAMGGRRGAGQKRRGSQLRLWLAAASRAMGGGGHGRIGRSWV